MVDGLSMAGEGVEAAKEGMNDRREGAKEIITSPTHLVEDVSDGMEGENPVAETAGGVVTGTAKTVGQTIEGAGGMIKGTGKVITAPIKALAD
jgi:hypothetical protein